MNNITILLVLLLPIIIHTCDTCYQAFMNQNCRDDEVGKESYTLHMSVHPHLDAYWIFNFNSYYDPQPQQGEVRGYFSSNRFTSVKQIFNTATNVLWESKIVREKTSNRTQQAHRSFFNSEMGFFKHWYTQQPIQTKSKVKDILKTKYWEILGGGYVEHDEGCAYYEDIIENFELGLHFLKEEFNYYPKVAISADSFGHSQSTLAILAHLGIEGFFVERSDQHILLKNKTQFIWRAQSTNGMVYGALPTHIRWAIHGFQDQFVGNDLNQNFCSSKEMYMDNLRRENSFLKRILKSTHIMRYFGHDFQQFNEYSYKVIQGMMKKFSVQKCNKVVAVYGNPTEYFITLMSQVFGEKIKPISTRSQDIFPIWDYDSGLYWTGYFTTDSYHKKNYRDMGRFLRGVRKFFLPIYLAQPQTLKNKQFYKILQQFAEQVSYLQHHDGISGTSKYMVMDTLQNTNKQLYSQVNNKILYDIFDHQFPLGTNAPIFTCHLDSHCQIPRSSPGDIYLKILNSDGNLYRDPIIIDLPQGDYYIPNCQYQINCFCIERKDCPCKIYIYKPISTYTTIKLQQVKYSDVIDKINKLNNFASNQEFSFNQSHFKIQYDGGEYTIGYKKVIARSTDRGYQHLSRYGNQVEKRVNIRPGKYALGNDPNEITDFSRIKQVSILQSPQYKFFLINWSRYQMKTLISIPNTRPNQWKIQTITATQAYYLSDLYFQITTPINNNNKFITDSNGWLTVQREMFKHQDYQAFFSKQKYDDINGNTYPATAFVYIKDDNDKVSVNLDRPQGVTSYKKGSIWINFDRLSQDDGKWVYQNAYRSQYQKYTHTITVKNKNNNEREIQRKYDQPLFIQGNLLSSNARVELTDIDINTRNKWNQLSNINNLKFNLRPFNDSTVILRVQNMNDDEKINIGLFSDHHSPLLTTFYGRTISFTSITQQSLGGNMEYSQFINSKWNWQKVINLTEQNKIFNKIFRENITLLPLQIRTFLLKDFKFDEKCMQIKDLQYNKREIAYQLNTNKPSPTREPSTIKIQQDIIEFMKNGDKCNGVSPVLDNTNVDVKSKTNSGNDEKIFKERPVENIVQIVPSETIPPLPLKAIIPANTQIIAVNSNQQSQQIALQPISPLLLENPLSIISNKINSLTTLSIQEKNIYFSYKLEQIRKYKMHSVKKVLI